MRICFLCEEYPPALHGGIGSHVQMIGRGLVRAGHDVRVIGNHPKHCNAPEYEEDQGVKVFRPRVASSRLRWITARRRLFRTVSRWCRDREVDLVEAVDFTGPLAMWPRLSVPLIARFQGSSTFFANELKYRVSRKDRWLEKQSLKRADFLCSVSEYAAERTRELFDLKERKIEILYNFVDTELPVKARHQRDKSIVFTGTLVHKKGIVSLVDAWHLVHREHPDAVLHIYGKDTRLPNGGSMKEMLVDRIPEAIRNRIVFHGHTARTELFTAFSTAAAGIFPSYSETFGIAPAESMAAGCPTIYSTCGCGHEVVNDGVDGLLANPDDPQSIAEAINRVLSDDTFATSLGAAGKEKVQKLFSIDVMLPKHIDFYERCLRQHRLKKSDPSANRNQHV